MRNPVVWFMIVLAVLIGAVYAFRLRPRSRAQWTLVALTVAFMAVMMLFTGRLRAVDTQIPLPTANDNALPLPSALRPLPDRQRQYPWRPGDDPRAELHQVVLVRFAIVIPQQSDD